MTYLLDTHAFYWLVQRGRSVPFHVQQALRGAVLRVSSISAYELARKQHLGKLDTDGLVQQWLPAVLRLGASELPVTTQHSLRAATMEWPHRDPFDRIIAAQALMEGLTLVTADRAFTDSGVDLLDWSAPG